MPQAMAPPSFLSTRRGKFTLILTVSVALLDLLDATVVNIALPSIQKALHLSVTGLQWVPNAYLLTYGGFMLLGGRAADLIGRRRVLMSGVLLIAVSSLVAGVATSSGALVGARLVQGLGAAFTMPAALSVLTTTFREGKDRHTAMGVWGAMAGIGSVVGVLLGGFLTEGPGWRWVFFVNPIFAALLIVPIMRLIDPDHKKATLRNFDAGGAILATGGMLLLIYALVEAPTTGWASGRTIGELVGAGALLVLFVANELRHRNPLVPMSIFRINGLGFANVTQFMCFAGFLALFFFLTLYMQEALHYSAIRTALAYLPLCVAIGMSSTMASQMLSRVGTRPVIVGGALVAGCGLLWLSYVSASGSYWTDELPGMLVLSVGFGAVFVAVVTAANAGVPADKAGLAAALVNASQQVGGALGLAVLTVLATNRTTDLLQQNMTHAQALNGGVQRALLFASFFVFAAALFGLRATNTRGETAQGIESNAMERSANGKESAAIIARS